MSEQSPMAPARRQAAAPLRRYSASEQPSDPIADASAAMGQLWIAARRRWTLATRVFAFARRRDDRTVRRVEDIDGFFGIPAVGAIPELTMTRTSRDSAAGTAITGESIVWAASKARASGRRWCHLDRQHDQYPALVHAFAALTAAVTNDDDMPLRTLVVTSPGIGDGKTTVSVNLAIALARAGRRVLLVDANLRSPSLHEALGLRTDRGLATYLTGRGEWQRDVRHFVLPSLSVIPAGCADSDPVDLVAGQRMIRLMDEASRTFDHLVIDSPPLLPRLPDAHILSSLSDGTLLTVRGGATPRYVARYAVSQLPGVIGVVVNGLRVHERLR